MTCFLLGLRGIRLDRTIAMAGATMPPIEVTLDGKFDESTLSPLQCLSTTLSLV